MDYNSGLQLHDESVQRLCRLPRLKVVVFVKERLEDDRWPAAELRALLGFVPRCGIFESVMNIAHFPTRWEATHPVRESAPVPNLELKFGSKHDPEPEAEVS